MRWVLFAVLLLFPWLSRAATIHIALTGNDTTGDGSSGNPYRTIAKGESVAVTGDTVNIWGGDFDEYVQVSGVLGVRFQSLSNAVFRAWRTDTASNTLSGVTLSKACDAGWRTWNAFLRIASDAHFTTVTNVKIIDQPWISVTNWSFNPSSPTNTISSPSVDFISKGFVTGGVFWVNGVSYSNTTRGAQFRFANQQRAVRPTNVTTTTLTFSNAVLTAETNPSVWAVISAGSTFDFHGILFDASGGGGPSNCLVASCLFSNMVGRPIVVNGHDNAISNNTFTACDGNFSIVYGGYNIFIRSNLFYNCGLPAYYDPLTDWETVDHTGGSFYDYYVNFIAGSSQQTINTNVWIEGNWFEDIKNNSISIQHTVPGDDTDFHHTYIIGNVFVGMGGPLQGGQNFTFVQSNTFYRCAYQNAQTAAVGLGGEIGIYTNNTLFFTHNLIVSCGDHATRTDEGYPSFTVTTNITSHSNYVCGPEVSRWNAMPAWNATNGLNGGDPMFVNEFNPRGPDGIPFTADDGMHLHPRSPAIGIGALPGGGAATTSKPIVFFRPTNVASNFLDATGTNFNPAWHSDLYAFTRTGWDREWDYGDALVNIPVTVQFSATNSISGAWSTNNYAGIKDWVWDFGDGSRPVHLKWNQSDVSHTYLTTGQVTVVLTVTNGYGGTASHQRNYRVMPISAFTNDIRYATTYNQLTNALKLSGPGDFIHVSPTNTYTNVLIEVDTFTASNGTEVLPITIVGYALMAPFEIQVNHWVFEGMEVTGSGDTNLNVIWRVPSPQTNLTFRNLSFHDTPSGTEIVSCAVSGGVGCKQIRVYNCRFHQIAPANGAFIISHCNDVILDGNHLSYSKRQGDIGVHGTNVTISRNFYYAHGYTNGNHADFIIYYNPATNFLMGNYLIERNWFEMPSVAEQFALSKTNVFLEFSTNAAVGDTITIAGITRRWTNVTSSADWIPIGATRELMATNFYQNATNFAWDPFWIITLLGDGRTVGVRGKSGPQDMTSSKTGDWGILYQTLEWSMPVQIANTGNSDSSYVPGFTNFVWRNNVCLNVYNGLNPAVGDKHLFYNNLFYRCALQGGPAILLSSSTGSSIGAEYKNNIFLESGTSTNNGWYDNGTLERSTNMTVVADYNYVAHTNFLPKQPWDASRPTNQYPFLWKLPAIGIHGITTGVPSVNQPAQEEHGINGGDPMLADLENYDITPLSDSFLINAGTSVVTNDFWGFPRIGEVDIGPVEFQAEEEAAAATGVPTGILRGGILRGGRLGR